MRWIWPKVKGRITKSKLVDGIFFNIQKDTLCQIVHSFFNFTPQFFYHVSHFAIFVWKLSVLKLKIVEMVIWKSQKN